MNAYLATASLMVGIFAYWMVVHPTSLHDALTFAHYLRSKDQKDLVGCCFVWFWLTVMVCLVLLGLKTT